MKNIKKYEVETYEELSQIASDIIGDIVKSKPDCVLGLATGSTPVGTYKKLVERNKNGELDFSRVTSVNLDEYIGLDGTNDQSYRYFMNDNLFDHVNIDKSRTFVPDGLAKDIENEGEKYDRMIEDLGGTDIQLLGLGLDGHIGFNEPADVFTAPTHLVDLHESTIKANSRFFANEDEVPKQAITMGMYSIMQSKKILLIVSGEAKRDILDKTLNGPVSPQVPASILQLHPDVTVIYSKN